MQKKIIWGFCIFLMLSAAPITVLAVVDENGCEWGISDNPIIVGDNSHGAGAGSSQGSSQSNTEVSGSTQHPSATIEQETGGGSSGTVVSDNGNPGSASEEYIPGGTSTEQIITPGYETSNSSKGDSGSTPGTAGSAGTNGNDNSNSSNSKDKDKDKNSSNPAGKDKNPSNTNDKGATDGTSNTGTGTNTGKNKDDGNDKNNGIDKENDNHGDTSGGYSLIYFDKDVGHSKNDGSVDWDKVPGTIKNVTVKKDGTMVIHVVGSSGEIKELVWDEYWSQIILQTVFDKDGNAITKVSTINLSEEVYEEWTYLYTAWSIMNATNAESKYYGGFTQVAKTKESSAKLWPDVDGQYRVIGTPWFHVRYYKIIERESRTSVGGVEVCTKWTEEVTISEDTLSKAPTEYTVDVPLICQGCPVPVMCINGACDPAKELNAVSDDAHKPNFDIEHWSELEK